MKSLEIPLLSRNQYRKTYFKRGSELSALDEMDDQFYFDIHYREVLADQIKPHRLNYYKLFLITKGHGIHTKGAECRCIGPGTIGFVGPNSVTAWQALTNEQEGLSITFSEGFFNMGRTDKSFLKRISVFDINTMSVFNASKAEIELLHNLFKLIHRETRERKPYFKERIRGILQTLIYKGLEFAEKEDNTKDLQAGTRILFKFQELYLADLEVIKKGKPIEIKPIAVYAEQIGVSQNHLNDTVKELTGKSAGRLIKDQIILQASICLRQSTKSVSEIAYLMGFEDSSYFTRYFKSKTGKTPTQLRKMNKTVEST